VLAQQNLLPAEMLKSRFVHVGWIGLRDIAVGGWENGKTKKAPGSKAAAPDESEPMIV
jgi:hypothetical protein